MRRSKSFSLLLIIVLLSGSLRIPRTAIAASSIQPPDQLAVADYIPPSMTTLAVMGNYAYIGAGPSLLVIDVSDPDHPQRVAYRLLPASARQVVATPGRLYVLTDDDRYAIDDNLVIIFDITKPQAPVRIGQIGPQSFGSLAAKDLMLYLSDRDGFSILDVSDPRQPIILSSVLNPDNDNFPHIYISGEQVLLTYSNTIDRPGVQSLWVMDVSDPFHPLKIGELSGSDGSLPNLITDLSVDNDLVALVGYSFGGVYGEFEFVLVDLSDPAQPDILGSENTYSGESPSITLLDGRVYTAAQDDFIKVFDISDPSAPLLLKTEKDPVWALASTGNLIFNAAGALGLAIYDSQGTDGLLKRGALLGIGTAQDVTVQGESLYIADGGVDHYAIDYYNGGLAIAALQPPKMTEVIGKNTHGGHGSNVEVQGNQAYLIAGNCGLRFTICSQDFYILDVLHPETISISGDFAFENTNYNSESLPGPLSIQDQIAYIPSVATGSGAGLAVLDISQPVTPTLLSLYKPPLPPYEIDAYSNVSGAAISGTYGLVSVRMRVDYDFFHSLQVIDVSNPYSLTALTTYPLPWPSRVVTQGPLGFVVVRDNQGDSKVLKLMDLSQLPQVQFLSDITTPGKISDIAFDGRYAYVADGESGLLMYDLIDPLHPVKVYAYDTAGNAVAVAQEGDWVYLADQGGGLLIFRKVTPQAYLPLLPLMAAP